MAAIDKAAVAWTIAIVAAGAGFAMAGLSAQEQDATGVQYGSFGEAVDASAGVMVEQTMETMMDETASAVASAASGTRALTVNIPQGTAVVGCEVRDACYIPSSIRIATGDTVTWVNDDTAAHTVTSGTLNGGVDGVFDSQLLLGGGTFEVTFDEVGRYDYFCVVHPWMVGSVQAS